MVNTDDEEYRMERRRRMVTRQNSLAPFNLVVSASGEEKSPEGGGEGFSKSKIQQLTRRWKLKAATASDDTFKVKPTSDLDTANDDYVKSINIPGYCFRNCH